MSWYFWNPVFKNPGIFIYLFIYFLNIYIPDCKISPASFVLELKKVLK